jgi:hypothetical protein
MNRLVRNVISTVQEVAFDYSAKKLHAFFDERDADATTKEHMEERTALQTLCEMRWTSRADDPFFLTCRCARHGVTAHMQLHLCLLFELLFCFVMELVIIYDSNDYMTISNN